MELTVSDSIGPIWPVNCTRTHTGFFGSFPILESSQGPSERQFVVSTYDSQQQGGSKVSPIKARNLAIASTRKAIPPRSFASF